MGAHWVGCGRGRLAEWAWRAAPTAVGAHSVGSDQRPSSSRTRASIHPGRRYCRFVTTSTVQPSRRSSSIRSMSMPRRSSNARVPAVVLERELVLRPREVDAGHVPGAAPHLVLGHEVGESGAEESQPHPRLLRRLGLRIHQPGDIGDLPAPTARPQYLGEREEVSRRELLKVREPVGRHDAGVEIAAGGEVVGCPQRGRDPDAVLHRDVLVADACPAHPEPGCRPEASVRHGQLHRRRRRG